ncbi:MAG: fructose-2,6-bisphosphatase [Solibacillus sp.]
MKKILMIACLAMLALVACGTTEEQPVQNAGAQPDVNEEPQAKTLILYKSDAQAESTMPFEVAYTGGDLVPFIFNEVNEHNVGLLDYELENEGKRLVLNLGDDIFSIQGSAGSTMFVHTLAQSYFENIPAIEDVTFLYNGSDEPVLDHMEIGKAYTRTDVGME